MWERSWRRLAACIAIELGAACGAWAAGPEFRAGTAQTSRVAALALEDRHGIVAVIAQAEFAISERLSDMAAAQLMRAYVLERGSVLLLGKREAPPEFAAADRELTTAMAAALRKLEPARILHKDGAIGVTDPDGRCLASIESGRGLALEGCTGGVPVRGPIRTAFRMVRPLDGLKRRPEVRPTHPVQAIALGREATILALESDSLPGDLPIQGVTFLRLSSEGYAPADDPQMRAAIRAVLKAVGRRYR